MEMVRVILLEEHATKEHGDGSSASSFLQISIVAEL